MSVLSRPGVLAALLVLLAAVLHPALGTAAWLPARPLVLAALALLSALGLGASAWSGVPPRRPRALVAAGAAVLLAAAAADGLYGHRGTVSLVPGQTRPHFDETGPGGRPLGLRPLFFVVGAERIGPDGTVTLVLPSGPVSLTPQRSVRFGGYRFARPRIVSTGSASRLRVAASDGARTWVAEVSPGAPGRAGDLTIALERFFPDFAVDARQQPFSRSSELRNPAALLAVERGGQTYRAFVLRSMPGVHRVEPLGLAFTLLEVEPEREAELAVAHEPAAPGLLAGGLLLVASLLLLTRERLPAGGDRALAPLVAGCGLLAVLFAVDRGAVLAWSHGVTTPSGRVPLAGVGVLLGAAFVAALGGSLLLAAQASGGGAGPAVRRVARGALWGAVALVSVSLLLAGVRLSSVPSVSSGGLRPLAGAGAAAVVLALALLASRSSPPPIASRALAWALPVGVLAALVAAVLVGVAAVVRDGTYATDATAAAAAAALLGLAALEDTAARGLRRAAFLVALLTLAAA